MGNGLVLEQGTHSELLRDENGPYSRLVTAQKLREKREVEDSDSVTGSSIGAEHVEKKALEEIPLGRKNTGHSLASDIIERRKKEQPGEKEENLSLFYLFVRMGKLNGARWPQYCIGLVAAASECHCCTLSSDDLTKIVTGMVYPAFGIVYAKGINAFSELDPHKRRHDGDRVALWLFLIAIISMFSIGVQNYIFASTAATLTAKLRSLSFRAILRQDGEFCKALFIFSPDQLMTHFPVEFFDREENATGSLTSGLSDNPQKVNGLAGVTLGA